MQNIPENLKALQKLVTDVSQIERRHYKPGTDIRENVAEHSMSVAMLAWFLHRYVNSKTDLDLVIKYALIHDFVEIYAGDVNTFASAKARTDKEVNERAALHKLADQFDYFSDMVNVMQAYQDMANSEALFAWTVDKIQSLIHGQADGWRTYREHSITREMFDDKMEELAVKASLELKPLFLEIVAWCKETY